MVSWGGVRMTDDQLKLLIAEMRATHPKRTRGVVLWNEWRLDAGLSPEEACRWYALDAFGQTQRARNCVDGTVKAYQASIRTCIIDLAVERGWLPPEAVRRSYPEKETSAGMRGQMASVNRQSGVKSFMRLLTHCPRQIAASLLGISLDELVSYITKEKVAERELQDRALNLAKKIECGRMDRKLLYPHDDNKDLLWTRFDMMNR